MTINYHNITTDDMKNGSGLRVVLWLSGCSHNCEECQNPQTWDKNSGIPFDRDAKDELFEQLENDYILGLTLSGGDPLFEDNLDEVDSLIKEVKEKFPSKNIWVYTGYKFEELDEKRLQILSNVNVLVDGKFEKDNVDVNYYYAGSTNQNIYSRCDNCWKKVFSKDIYDRSKKCK